jgi:nanoRNase/pAp phosphatase (c-di-AMP/oligoRNAs hydrolase)
MAFDVQGALERIRDRGPLLILPHDNPDPDAIAAALGLQRLVDTVGCAATIGFGGIIGRAENRALVHELGVALQPVSQLDPARFPLIALVDTQPGTGNNSLPAGRRADVVIDHHPARPDSLTAPWCDIRDSGASSALVYDYLRRCAVPIDSRLATAFLYAIKSETRDLGREADASLRAIYLEVFALADHARLHAISHPKLGREHFVAVDRALHAAEVRGPLVTANLGTLDYPDLVAEVADLLLAFDRARWVLCVGQHAGTVYLSIRTDVAGARAGELIRRLIGKHGAGGGHGMIAGGRMFATVADEQALARVYDDLASRLAVELHADAATRRLL